MNTTPRTGPLRSRSSWHWGGVFLLSLATCLLPFSSPAAAPTLEQFLQQIQSGDGNQRRAAWENAGPLGAEAIAPLVALYAKYEPAGLPDDQIGARQGELDVAKAAGTALDVIVHHAKRPGAAAELRAVNRELVKLIGAGQPELVRVKALDLLASTGGDAEVPAIAALLREPDAKMRERARTALERIPGRAANQALLAALPTAPADFRRDLILTLGAKKATEAVATLLSEARNSDKAVRLAAVEALGRIGDSRARQAIEQAVTTFEGADRRTAIDSYLRLADHLAARDRGAAAGIYRSVLEQGGDDALRCAALVGLGKAGEAEALPVLIDTLDDASAKVRNAALTALVKMSGPATNQTLAERARSAPPARKAMLLRVLAAREAPQAAALLRQASQDPNAEVRVTALDLLGGLDAPGLEDTLLEAAEKGSPAIRPVALRSYVRLAETRLKSGKKAEALAMYHRALDLATADDVKRSALAGIAGIASNDSLEKVEELMAEGSSVRDDATRAYIEIVAAMGEAGQKDEAIRRLTAVVEGTRDHGIATLAIGELRQLGADTSGFAAKAGFLTRWWLLGPVPFGDDAPFEKSFLNEAEVNPQELVTIDDKTLRWKRVQTDDTQGRVNLEPQFDPHNNVAAYAYTVIQAPRERDVHLRIGSDDGFIAWLNGERIAANNATRALAVDQDTVKAKLNRGPNRLLLKITQGGGQWEFCVRVTNTQNKPLDLTRWGETLQ